jgi:hypothetical protein
MITTEQKNDLWEKLHDCYSVTNIASRALEFEDTSDKRDPFPSASYATALQRVSKVLLEAIALLDNLPEKAI